MLRQSSLQEVPVDLAHVVRESLANELEAQCANVRGEFGEAIAGPGLGNALRGLLKVELEACSRSLHRKINEDLSSSLTQMKELMSTNHNLQGTAAFQIAVEDLIREQRQILLQLQLHLQKQNDVPKLVVPTRSQGSWYSHVQEAPAAEVVLPGAVESDVLVEEIRHFDDTSSSTRSQPGERRSQKNEGSSETKLLRFNDSVVPVASCSSSKLDNRSHQLDSSWEAKKNARKSRVVELTGFMKEGLSALVADEDGSEMIPDSETFFARVRRITRRFLEKPAFDGAMSFLILLNAISIGAQTNAQLSRSDTTDKIFEVVDKIFFAIFLTELMMRLVAYGLSFFRSKEWQWNFFDTGIVGLQAFETISSALIRDDSSNQGTSFSFLRIMRILRLARIFRIVRLLRFVQELRTMVSSIASSMKSLVWTLVLLSFLMYVSAICVCQAIIYAATSSSSDIFQDAGLNKYYNSLLMAILTLFEAMTGGVNWDDAMRPLMDHVSPWMTVFFCIFIAFSVLAMMNVITGVFVESALQTAKQDKDNDVLLQLQRVFKLADKDGSGSLTWDEFQEQLLTPHTKKVFSSLDIELQEARGLFILLDTDGSGTINCEEFLQGCIQLRGPARAIEMSTLMYYNKRMGKWWSRQLTDLHKSIRSLQEALKVDSRHLIYQDDTTQAHAFATWAELKSGAYATSSKTEQPDQGTRSDS